MNSSTANKPPFKSTHRRSPVTRRLNLRGKGGMLVVHGSVFVFSPRFTFVCALVYMNCRSRFMRVPLKTGARAHESTDDKPPDTQVNQPPPRAERFLLLQLVTSSSALVGMAWTSTHHASPMEPPPTIFPKPLTPWILLTTWADQWLSEKGTVHRDITTDFSTT